LRIAGVEVTTGSAFDLPVGTVEHPDMGLFGFQIGFQPSDQEVRQRNVAVFFAFAVFDMQDFPVKIQVGNLQIPNFKATQTTPVQQTNQYAMLEQIGCFEQSADFFLTQDYGKLFAVLDGGKFDPFILHPFDPVGEAEGIDGELEVGIRWGIVSPLDQMKVVIDPVWVHLGGQFIEVKGQFGQVAAVVGNRTLTFTGHGNFLLKLGQ
jgi:hypothetical protein